ncbi:hypothetical protein WA026_000908 [Henosepilachna vigintioctopunctata]|uniref:Hydrocephalus-inducing protein n=1 Tax=Henosepilachna vigintioctopunctata TaxID=420089 RepID=A0AAW1V8M0_9CUCU
MFGHCREPLVYYEHPYVALETTLIYSPADKEIILKNDEDEGIHFRFKKSTLVSTDQQVLTVSPMSGLMKPKSKNAIRFSSESSKCGETIFNVKCLIQYMSIPLQLNVITNVIQVTSSLIYFSKELISTDMEPNVINVINLGVIIPHKKEELRFELQNTCSVGLYYSWSTEDKLLKTRVQFLQEKGYLTSLHNKKFTIFLTAVRPSVIKNTFLKLHILYGPSYIFRIEASANKPMYSFSFFKYDFGKCIIQKEPMKYYNTELVFTNHNTMTVVLENGQSGSSEFVINFKSAKVKPDESITINICFNPTETKSYKEFVPFFVNSHKLMVKLFGHGVPLALNVFSPSEKFLNFGAVKLGKIVQKSVRILNSSEATVNAIFDFNCRLPFHKKLTKEDYIIEESTVLPKTNERHSGSKADSKTKGTKDDKSGKTNSNIKLMKGDAKKKSKDSNSMAKSIGKNTINSEMLNTQLEEELNQFLKESFEIIPNKQVKIIPGGTIELLVKFKPKKCRDQFQANVFFDVLNYREPILHIIGSAVDANFRLNKEVVAFGNVVVGYPNEETIVLINDGHIGGKFKWFLEKKTSYVSFIGGEGFSPPNSKVTTTVIFKPGHVQCFFRFKAYCKIENYDKQLNLLLTGGSMNIPPPLDTIKFETAVREETSQNVVFKNETKESWNTKPIFTGAFFSGNELLHVPKESSVSYEITYAPMKFSNSPHEGTIFFPLPCGFSRLYSLKGIVSQPKPVEVISRDITSKTYHTEILKVKNWLGLRQTFKVVTKVMEVDSGRVIYKITSNNLIEVPPHGSRDFKWTIYVLNEGKLSLKVSFVNEKSKDYIYYQIALRITTSENNIETIAFSTCVRIPVTKYITIANPLHETLDYTSSTTSPHIFMDSVFKIPPYEKYQLAVKYLPVKVENTVVRLHLDNPQIGGQDYNLNLRSHPPNLENEVRFKGHLGQTVSETIFLPQELHNHDLNAKITENPCFEVLRINTQTDIPYADVCFIPIDLGTSRGSLHIFSYMGEHTYPLVGECIEPKPQGPLVFRYGETINIDFTNPFEETKLFEFSVDNDFFQVQPLSETIKEKKSIKLTVTTQGNETYKQDSKSSLMKIQKMGTVTGKMFVECAYENSPLQWIYYLQCEMSIK